MGWYFLILVLLFGLFSMEERADRIAKAIEAQSVKTACGLDPKDESAVGTADLPKGGGNND